MGVKSGGLPSDYLSGWEGYNNFISEKVQSF
jgi:hypothetical protein